MFGKAIETAAYKMAERVTSEDVAGNEHNVDSQD
jgi:hypothetical protein